MVPSTPKTGAGRLAEQLRERIEDAFRETQAGSAGGPLTVSLGVATYPADGGEAEELIRNADRALYLAKSGGKNQVQFYERSRRSFRRVRLELRVGISSRGAPSSSCGRSMCRPADCASRVPSKCRSARSSICVSRHRIRIAGWGWWAEHGRSVGGVSAGGGYDAVGVACV